MDSEDPSHENTGSDSDHSKLPASPSLKACNGVVANIEPQLLSQHLAPHRSWLQESGSLRESSGVLTTDQDFLALHTHFGPSNQDKSTNQDYALAWMGERGLIVALADGLTDSFRSEWAAKLACFTAVHSLADATSGFEPQKKVEAAITAANFALARLVDTLARDAEASCPSGLPLYTWQWMLNGRRSLFQTTLTLAWLEVQSLRLGIVGDGAFVLHTDDPLETIVETKCSMTTEQVHALKPFPQASISLDIYWEKELSRPFFCALCTDGIARGFGLDLEALLRQFIPRANGATGNSAEDFLNRMVYERPREFDDNLTLAVLHGF